VSHENNEKPKFPASRRILQVAQPQERFHAHRTDGRDGPNADLIECAAGIYQRNIQRAKEAVLKEDLQEMRKAIDNYTMDKQAAPQSLDDLVPQYLRIMPVDPITTNKD
jgi:hypothetical protein